LSQGLVTLAAHALLTLSLYARCSRDEANKTRWRHADPLRILESGSAAPLDLVFPALQVLASRIWLVAGSGLLMTFSLVSILRRNAFARVAMW
jgi:hypothetical protein